MQRKTTSSGKKMKEKENGKKERSPAQQLSDRDATKFDSTHGSERYFSVTKGLRWRVF